MTSEQTPGLGEPDDHDPIEAHLPERVVRPPKIAGLVGYGFLLAAIALLGVTLAAAAFDTALVPWIVATAVCAVIGLGFLVASRMVLTRQPAHDRAQHDPLIPEVTEEEAVRYEQAHHRRPDPR